MFASWRSIVARSACICSVSRSALARGDLNACLLNSSERFSVSSSLARIVTRSRSRSACSLGGTRDALAATAEEDAANGTGAPADLGRPAVRGPPGADKTPPPGADVAEPAPTVFASRPTMTSTPSAVLYRCGAIASAAFKRVGKTPRTTAPSALGRTRVIRCCSGQKGSACARSPRSRS